MKYNDHRLRHELKYLISYTDYVSAAETLKKVMKPDEHNRPEGNMIRSLYLDDVYSRAYNEKLDGIERRRKHRIRIYNMDDGLIKYEVKDKFDSYISKSSVSITREQAREIIGGRFGFLAGRKPERGPDGRMRGPDGTMCDEEDIKAVVYGLIDSRTRLLRPKVIVDYFREAYVCNAGNVRVTFDYGLRAGIASYDIFDPNIVTVPAIDSGKLILEVKYDDFLPVHIRSLLRQFCAWQTSESKYVMCVSAKNTYYRKDIPYVFI